ncbi:hypothetical protein RCH23_001939 [Cryobacterium sp. CAN_C3]|nr:hypothetical protein [Cryobacterium sp. CAN_C3]
MLGRVRDAPLVIDDLHVTDLLHHRARATFQKPSREDLIINPIRNRFTQFLASSGVAFNKYCGWPTDQRKDTPATQRRSIPTLVKPRPDLMR